MKEEEKEHSPLGIRNVIEGTNRLPNEVLIDEGMNIIKAADKNDLVLRLLGGLAFQIHCNELLWLYKAMGREPVDIDLAGYLNQANKAARTIEDLGYSFDKHHAAFHPGRHVFYREDQGLKIEIFYDKLEMCHTIELRDRLPMDYPTIPLAEMFLQKMQIVSLTEKDQIDTAILLLAHDVGEGDKETINTGRIATLLSNDWGLYYSVTRNIATVRNDFLAGASALTEENKAVIRSRIDRMLGKIDATPKSVRWKMRAKIGPRRIWYNEVENLTR